MPYATKDLSSDSEAEGLGPEVGGRWVVWVAWIDTSAKGEEGDWWWEEPGPMPLVGATILAASMRAAGWSARVLRWPENPRRDGRWDNP